MDRLMVENTERRKSVRIDHTSPLKVEDRNSGKIYKARMLNFSDNGLYFESDSVLESGNQIYIGIQDPPYASANGVFEYHRSEIRWRKKLKDSYFEYGYGIKFCTDLNKRSSKSTNFISRTTEENEQKKLIRNTIKISDKSKSYEGLIKDISPSGVFFAAEENFEEGQILSFSVPVKNDKEIKINGQIVWADDDGFGVIFINKS
jgi:Tfp pilus assembly protein PilZ